MPGSSAEHPEIIPEKLPEQSPPLGHTWAACPGPSLHICRSTQCRCKCLVPKEAGSVAAVSTEIPACPDRGCSAQHLYLLLSSAASRGCTWGRGFCLQNIYTSPWRRSAPAGRRWRNESNPSLASRILCCRARAALWLCRSVLSLCGWICFVLLTPINPQMWANEVFVAAGINLRREKVLGFGGGSSLP